MAHSIFVVPASIEHYMDGHGKHLLGIAVAMENKNGIPDDQLAVQKHHSDAKWSHTQRCHQLRVQGVRRNAAFLGQMV